MKNFAQWGVLSLVVLGLSGCLPVDRVARGILIIDPAAKAKMKPFVTLVSPEGIAVSLLYDSEASIMNSVQPDGSRVLTLSLPGTSRIRMPEPKGVTTEEGFIQATGPAQNFDLEFKRFLLCGNTEKGDYIRQKYRVRFYLRGTRELLATFIGEGAANRSEDALRYCPEN